MADKKQGNKALNDFVNIFGVKENKQVEIFLYILNHCDPETNIFIGTYKKIAKDVKCSETTIAKIMKKLQQCDLIHKIQNGVWEIKEDFLDENGNLGSLLGIVGSSISGLTQDITSKSIHSQVNDDTQVNKELVNDQEFEIEILNPKSDETITQFSPQDTYYKVDMDNPIVEIDGDEMTRIIWKLVKRELIHPFVNLNTVYFDLGIENRDFTDDQVTIDAADAIKTYKVGVKCATITPNDFRMQEYHLHRLYKSPNGTIRSRLDGTVFRCPILVNCITPCVRNWTGPITIARHAYGDLYSATESGVQSAGKAVFLFEDQSRNYDRKTIFTFTGPGIVQCQYNTKESIEKFARSCFNYALDTKQDLWFSAKDTISKIYDQLFKETFETIFNQEYKVQFEEAGISYFYTLIDDAVARVMRSEGGFIWALKNYDGDVMSDMVASAFGALAMMTSVLVSPDGCYEYEAAHGTVQRHYYKYQKGEETSTNSVATIFAWAGALKKRGQLDNNQSLIDFGDRLMWATKKTIESGKMTKDLANITTFPEPTVLNTEEFILAIKENMGTAVNPAFKGHGKQTIKNYSMKAQTELMQEPVSFSYYNDFFDTKYLSEKIEIVQQAAALLTDDMIDDFASSMDIDVPHEGTTKQRCDYLLAQMYSKAKFTDVIVN